MLINPQSEAVPAKVHRFRYDKARDGLAIGITVPQDAMGLVIELQGPELDRLLVALNVAGFFDHPPTSGDRVGLIRGEHGDYADHADPIPQ